MVKVDAVADDVKINGDKVEDTRLTITEPSERVYQVGKRKFARVTVQ